MLNITHYQRNANQNHNEVPSHAGQKAIIKKSTNSKCWRGCGAKATLLHCWWECKLVQTLQRTVWRFLKKLKIELPYAPTIPLLDVHPRKPELKETHVPQCSLQHYLQYLGHGSNLDVHWQMNGLKKLWVIYTLEYYSFIKKNAL